MAMLHKAITLSSFMLLAVTAQAGIWPEDFGPGKRANVSGANVTNPKLWSEYGLQESEKAAYSSDTEPFTAIAYRLQDSTAALAALQWQRPADAKPSSLGKLAAETSKGLLIAHGNYLLVFDGTKPLISDLERLYQTLPKLDQAPLPALPDYLPAQDLVPNSQRYITGPVGLQTFYSGVEPSMAAFHLGVEAQIGTFQSGGAETKLAIFSYPTPTIARERLAAMEKLPSAIAKRSGPLVAVILSAPDADSAERVLSQVKYQATVSWNEYVPGRRDNIGDLVVNAFILIGALLAFSTVVGLAFGGLRALMRRGRAEDPDALTVLHL